MLLNVKDLKMIEKQEEENQVNSKLLNNQKRECNNYFLEAYINKQLKEKKKKNRKYFANVETLSFLTA